MRPLHGSLVAILLMVATTDATAADTPTSVKPAAERSITSGPAQKPTGTPGGAPSRASSSGRPIMRGPKIPEALRASMQKQLDQRIDRDIKDIRELRGEAHGLLSTFVSETPRESPEMPEAMMRLGEIKWEMEREAFVERFKQWEAKPVDQRGATPEPNYVPSRDLFGRVLKDYPWFKDYDLALYVDGFLATEQNKPDDALLRFERILKEYPRSRFTPDAHMAKAESLFNGKYDYQGALAEYEQVMKFKGQTDLYGLALFKSAWCQWRLGNTEEAARRFVSVFEVADTQGKAASASQKKQLDELQGEALKYLVEVFTEDDKNTANDVYGFLTKIGGDRFAGKVVKALAETFYDQAHYERGIEAYELLIKLDPTSRDAGFWVMQIAAGWATLEDYPKLRATYERALAGYTQGGAWTRTQADPANVAATQAKIESQLREHAKSLHGKAQKDRTSRAEYDGAASLYDIYLSKFAGQPNAYQIQFYLAEIQFYHLDKNMDAATHYMAAAKTIPNAEAQHEPLRTMRHDAIYNAIAALERVRVAELDARKKAGAQGGQETESDKKFAEALDLYAQLYPNDPSLPELFFRQGKLYYDYGVYDPAVKIWGALLEKFPRSQYAQGAGELILDSFNKSKNYENIETWARRLKAAPSFQGREQQAKLDVLIVQAVFKQGEQKANAGDHAGAGAAYLRAAKEFPRDQRAAQACVNAELEAQKAGDAATLKEAATLAVGKDYKDKAESPQGAWIAATTFQAMGLFSEAADFDEAIASSNDKAYPHYQKFDHTKDAAFNAVVLRTATGEHDKAIANGNRYLAAFGTSAEADEVVFQMGRAHQNAGRHKEAADLYKRYLARSKNQDHRVQGFVLLAIAQLKMNDEKGADESLKDAVAIGKRARSELGVEGKYAAARARYMEGERVLARFESVQISGDVKQLSQRLKQKAELLKAASIIFLDTVSLGVAEWSTAALYQIGHTYEAFAKALRDSPPPGNLSEADKEVYTQQIEEFVVPVEEKSLDAYENGWKKAVELGIYNQWTAKMREALGRLNAELYPPFKETGFDVRTAAPSPLPALIDAPRRGAAAAGPAAPTTAPTPVAATPAAPATPATPAGKPVPTPKPKPAPRGKK
ncbi:MAG: domain protein putative component of TonB system [Myxococcaceae bacterium]|nr:domain protein putative component of TonB system [Myxococcaceae bacterium]